jgi:Holliday junction resolvasome RuvABC endonuclease subunit
VARPSTKLSSERLRQLARVGAETVLKQLRTEIIAVERTFPELALPQTRHAVARTLKTAKRRGRQMSDAARKAVSKRMKKYWAERKKAKAKVK